MTAAATLSGQWPCQGAITDGHHDNTNSTGDALGETGDNFNIGGSDKIGDTCEIGDIYKHENSAKPGTNCANGDTCEKGDTGEFGDKAECEMRDVGDRCSFLLPTRDASPDHLWVIGLTSQAELGSCVAEQFSTSPLVTGLLHIQWRGDGYWAMPHVDLPLILNDEPLTAPMLLSHGSVLMVGGHTFTYVQRDLAAAQDQPENGGVRENRREGMGRGEVEAPPRKPQRGQSVSGLVEEVLSLSQLYTLGQLASLAQCVDIHIDSASWDQSQNHSNVKQEASLCLRLVRAQTAPEVELERSLELFRSLRGSIVNNDLELLEHVTTPEQMVSLLLSYLLQFSVSHGLSLSTREMDVLYHALTVVCAHQPRCLFEFFSEMRRMRVVREAQPEPFLALLSNLLLLCLDDASTCELCLSVLAHLSTNPSMCLSLTRLTAVVCGALSVYTARAHTCLLACRFLQNLATHWRPCAPESESDDRLRQFPVREAALELLLRALRTHRMRRTLVVAALGTLQATMAAHSLYLPEKVRVASDTGRRSLLDFLAVRAVPVAMDTYQAHPEDKEIGGLCELLMEGYALDSSDTYQLAQAPDPSRDAGAKMGNAVGDSGTDSTTRKGTGSTNETHGYVSEGHGAVHGFSGCGSGVNEDNPYELMGPPKNNPDTTQTSQPHNLRDELIYADYYQQEDDEDSHITEGDVDAVYSTVNKTSRTEHQRFREPPTKQHNIEAEGESSDSEPEGPPIDYSSRQGTQDNQNNKMHSHELSDEFVNISLKAERPTFNPQTQSTHKPQLKLNGPSTTKLSTRLGRYLRKLKPRRKSQTYVLPHELEQSQSYIAFERCDSDYEVTEGEIPQIISQQPNNVSAVTSRHSYRTASFDDADYAVIGKLDDLMYDSHSVISDNPDHAHYQARQPSEGCERPLSYSSIYRLTPIIHKHMYKLPNIESNAAHETSAPPLAEPEEGLSEAEEDGMSTGEPSDRSLRTGSACGGSMGSLNDFQIEEVDENEFEFGLETTVLDSVSEQSLDVFIPHECTSMDATSMTSDDAFVAEASKGLDLNYETIPDDDVLGMDVPPPTSSVTPSPNTIRHLKVERRVSEGRDIEHSDCESLPTPPLRRHLSVPSTAHAPDSTSSQERTHSIPFLDSEVHHERYIGSPEEDVGPSFSDKWSPQDKTGNYGTMKRLQTRPDGKARGSKSAWVSALKQLYEKPQKKISATTARWRRVQSCNNITTSREVSRKPHKDVHENPLYTGMHQSVSGAHIPNTGNKARGDRKLPWRRRKSKDIPVLPTERKEEMNVEEGSKRKYGPPPPDNPFPRNHYPTMKGERHRSAQYPGQSFY